MKESVKQLRRTAWTVVAALLLLDTCMTATARKSLSSLEITVCTMEPTWALLSWQPGRGVDAYRVSYRSTIRLPKQRWRIVQTQNPWHLLRDLKPDTEYQLRVSALARGSAAGKRYAVLARGEALFTTPPDRARLWQGLEIHPSRALNTLGATTWPALASLSERLFLFEFLAGGLYVSELKPGRLTPLYSLPLLAGTEGTDRFCLTACVLGGRIWLTWIERQQAGGIQMLASWAPDEEGPITPTEIARARWCSMAPAGDQLWLVWQPAGSGDKPFVAAPYTIGVGLGQSTLWDDTPPGAVQPSVASFHAQMAIPFIVEQDGRRSLWCTLFNSEAFTDMRMLRRLGDSSTPRACALEGFLYVVYNNHLHYSQGATPRADLVVTQVDPGGFSLSSTVLVGDGNFNCCASLALLDGSLWVAYNKSFADPATSRLINLGTFLTRIALPPLQTSS